MRNSIPFLTGRCRISARRLLHGGRSSATLFFVELPGAGAATGAERRLRGGGKGGREGEREREREGPTRPDPPPSGRETDAAAATATASVTATEAAREGGREGVGGRGRE